MVDDVFVELVFVDEISVFVSVELSLVVSVVLLIVELVELDWLDGKRLLVQIIPIVISSRPITRLARYKKKNRHVK